MEVERAQPIQDSPSGAASSELGRELVVAAQGGDAGAFRELYEAYRDRIYSLVVYSIGDPTQSQDVFQAVFFKIFRGLRSFRFQSSLSTWIYRIAHNECQDHHRSAEALH